MLANIEHIEAFYSAQKNVLDRLRELGEISLANDIESVLAKNLVIASASYFEDFITAALMNFVASNTGHPGLSEFCKKVSQRQYHSWFDWDKPNANKFVQMFGEVSKATLATHVAQVDDFETSIKNFMFLGSQRNLIVHRNMLAFSFSDTSDEVIRKIRHAVIFVNFISTKIFGLTA